MSPRAGLSWAESDAGRVARAGPNARWPHCAQPGSFQPFEKEYLRKDGSRVPVLIGGTLFEGESNQGVAFVIDQSERKRAENGVA